MSVDFQGLSQPTAGAGLWQAGDPGFITPIANVGLQVPTSIQLTEQAAAPAFAANTGHLYVFAVLGQDELHYVNDVGGVTQLTGVGGFLFHSLQFAYNDGTTINTTALLGSVTINNAIANASSCLELNRTLAVGGYALRALNNIAIVDTGGVNLSTITMNGTDLEVTNATALGDMIFNSTVEIRHEIAGDVRTILGTSTYINQKAAGNNIIYLDTYSAGGERSILRFRRSRNATLGVLTPTINGSLIGRIDFQGVDSGSNFDTGVVIKAVQNGASGVKVPIDLIFSTFTSTAENVNQFILRTDGLHSYAFGEIQPVVRVDDADHAVVFANYYVAIHTLAANDRTVTIAAAQEIEGRVLVVKLEGATAGQKVTINPNSNIEGVATLDLTNDNESASIIYDGIQWQVF